MLKAFLVCPGGIAVSCWTGDDEVSGLTRDSVHCQVMTLGKLFMHVLLSPSSIIWYQSKGSDALWLGR